MKYTRRIITAMLTAAFCLVAFSASPVFADSPSPTAQSDICAGISGTSTTNTQTNTTTCNAGSGASVSSIIKDVINILSSIAGAAAVIMIVIAGFQYVTSGGDSGKIGNARTTITYALVGIVIIAFAQFLVQFVLNKVTK